MSSEANYEVIREIGRGTFGVAYLVKNKRDKIRYVLKKIRLARQSDKQREASLREMHLLSKLHHPNIVRYKESWLEKGCVACIVTQHCDGGDLFSILQQTEGRFLREELLLEWFVQMCFALQYLHRQKVLHRDVKSSNIFLDRSGFLKLGDFGLARVLDQNADFAQTVVGTPNYMSPEILQDLPYNDKSDVWALGCVMYELTALRPAFQAFNLHGLMQKIVKGTYAPVPACYSHLWRMLIRAMLMKDPNERPTVTEALGLEFLQETVARVAGHVQEEMERMQPQAASEGGAPDAAEVDAERAKTLRRSKKRAARKKADRKVQDKFANSPYLPNIAVKSPEAAGKTKQRPAFDRMPAIRR